MKYIIGFNCDDVDGFQNVGLRKNLQEVIEHNSAEEILAINSLNFIHHNEFGNFIEELSKFLKKDGECTINGTDIFSVASYLVSGDITLSDYINIIYGDDNSPKRYVYLTIDQVCDKIISCGCKVKKKWFNGSEFYITFKKLG